MEASTDLIINLIQNNRILYDKSMKDFKNTRKKDEVWERIAEQSRMTVDAAKKRYASLRQKYCREKKNIEVKRRYKCSTRKCWVYFDRLQFLDSFIIPRSTFTNDTLFEEENDENESEMDTGTENLNGNSCIEIEMEDGVNIDEMELHYENEDVVAEGQIAINENNEENGYDQHPSMDQHPAMDDDNTLNTTTKEVISDYTGEVSTITSMLTPDESVGQICQQNDSTEAGDNEMIEATQEALTVESLTMDGRTSPHSHNSTSNVNSLFRRSLATAAVKNSARDKAIRNVSNQPAFATDFEDSFDMDSYISNRPGTSASQAMMPPSSRHIRTNTSVQHESSARPLSRSSAQQTLPKTSKSNEMHSSSQHQSRKDSITPKKSNVNRPVAHRSNEPIPRTNDTTSAAPAATPFSKEQRIEAIRQRMESCLSAITNKVTEKSERSPHAPFLAYLATKLASVPLEILPNLEREILELVNNHSN